MPLLAKTLTLGVDLNYVKDRYACVVLGIKTGEHEVLIMWHSNVVGNTCREQCGTGQPGHQPAV